MRRTAFFGLLDRYRVVEEQEWISDPWYRRVNLRFASFSRTNRFDLGRATGPRLYSNPPSHESALGESLRILRKRKWIVLGSLVTIFSVVAIASLKMPKVYEANGTIEINKPDPSLNFQNSTTFSLDYFDPTELETDMKILQSDLLALQVIRDLNLDRRPELGGQASAVHRSCA